MTQYKFLQTLFDAGDETCFANGTYETQLAPVFTPDYIEPTITPFFVINALQYSRADQNVTKHRTFMLEFDTMPLMDQIEYVKNSKVPLSAIVFSGNKSFHFFITLQEEVSPAEYTCLAKRLHLLLPEADKSTKNPSRFARMPSTIRRDTGRVQALIALEGRVSLTDLLAVLPELPARATTDVLTPKESTSVFQRSALIQARKEPDKIMNMLGIRGRNNFLFWVGARLSEDNMSLDFRKEYVRELYENFEDKSNFSWKEACSAARID